MQMQTRIGWLRIVVVAAAVLGSARCGAGAGAAAARQAAQLLEAAGVRGGLVVHLGCGDGTLTAALRASERYVVHGLDADAAQVAAARERLAAAGLYGPVSVARLTGRRLPYADNLVNLIVASGKWQVTSEELVRVLAPRGVLLAEAGSLATAHSTLVARPVPQPNGWVKAVKPWPKDIDEWPHFLHDASNNAVAQDSRVGPPRRLQWQAGPTWCRSHEFISSFSVLVTAGGRVFYVMDLGQPGVTDQRMPERWTLFGRDGFNGVLLWQRPLAQWRGPEWRSRAMRGRPPSVPRRMAAARDRLFISLSHQGPLEALDPATGESLRTFEGTEGTQEVALLGQTLVLRIARLEQGGRKLDGAIAAVDAEAGTMRWRVPEGRFLVQSLCAAQGRVAYSTGPETVCLGLADGKELWRATTFEQKPQPAADAKGRKRRRRGGQQTFILHGDVVLVTDGSRIVARHAATGAVRWSVRTGGGSMRGHDFFVARGCAWHAASGGIAGYDLATGKVAKTIDPSSVQSRGHHLRCYRAKATERFLITQFRGCEFISLTGGAHSQNDWTRGPCRHGVMPANGMLYAPPHQCFCYPGATANGFNAYATASDAALEAIGPRDGALERGPAFAGASADRPAPADWPMYRRDARRTGAAACAVPAEVGDLWQAKLGSRLTPPVVAAGKVYVADRDHDVVVALGAADGKAQWRFIAGGPLDSAPSVHAGRVLFGCADGWVYCLRASDGVLAWRFRAAPAERLIVAEGRVESAWRVHSSLPVVDGVVYCAAGRSSFLDGGLFLYGLDPATGKVVHRGRLHTLMATREDAEKRPFLASFHIEGTRSDILVAEGGHLFLNQMQFSPDLEQQDTPYVAHAKEDKEPSGLDVADQPYVAENPYLKKGFGPAAALGVSRGHLGDRQVARHLMTTGGFLDDSWWNRTFWMYGATWPGYQLAHIAPKAGQLVVVGPATTYAVQAYPTRNVHSPMFTPASKGYLLVADRNDNEPMLDYRSWSRDKGMGFTRRQPPAWYRWVPLRMRAMVLARERLFVAGAPDVVDAEDPMAAFEGRAGARLCVFAAADGTKLAERALPAAPVLDGLIAAQGRLYLSTRDGRVLCLGAP